MPRFRVEGLGSTVPTVGILRFRVLGFRDVRFRDLGFRVWGLGSRVEGLRV